MGNRTTQNSPSGQTTYGYDGNNRLLNANSTTYGYDNNGNLRTMSNGTTFDYDAHNRLSQANLPGGAVVQYTYNGDGVKIRRIEGSAVTRYYHDGSRPIYETKGDGSLNAQLDRDIFGNLLGRKADTGSRYYYHHDGLGSTVALTNASGQEVAKRGYDAWGNLRASTGSAPGNYQYTGAELDPTSGLYHIGFRFYDPTIGRWLTEDIAQDSYFDPRTLNYYAYAFNNPALLVDQDGLMPTASDPGGPRFLYSSTNRTTGLSDAVTMTIAVTALLFGAGVAAINPVAGAGIIALAGGLVFFVGLVTGETMGYTKIEVQTVTYNGNGTATIVYKVYVFDDAGHLVRTEIRTLVRECDCWIPPWEDERRVLVQR